MCCVIGDTSVTSGDVNRSLGGYIQNQTFEKCGIAVDQVVGVAGRAAVPTWGVKNEWTPYG